jgi:serine/threonine protein kinase
MLGSVIGSYRVTKKLGEGGMGAVYLGEHSLLGRQAAIKVLLPMLSARQDVVNRFFNEARATTAIADPGIVQIFDFGYHTDGSAFIVMEFLDGEALDARLQRLGRLHPLDALRIARQLAQSLAAAHAKGIVHRDLKPENVFLVSDHEVVGGERVKILDFGIAKLADDHPGKVKTHAGALMGTPVYMSPEQCRGAGDLDHRSDIYALGCVLFHLLVGRPPFDGDGIGEIIVQHLREPAPAPSSRAPGIPPEVDSIVLYCLAKAPGERFQNMTDLANAIGAVLQHLAPGSVSAAHVVPYAAGATPLPGYGSRPPTAPPPAHSQPPPGSYPGSRPPGAPPPAYATGITPTTLGGSAGAVSTPPPRRSRTPVIMLAALALAGAAGGTFALTRPRQPAAAPALPAIADAAVAPPLVPPDAAPAPPDAGVPDAAPPPADAAPPDARTRRSTRPRPDDDSGRHRDDLDGDGIPDVR